jgi:gliding motility-associated-like protein
MDNFNNIIKQKVEQFDVPFNEAHWAEMDGKLNKIRATKIKNTIFGTAAAVAIIAATAYFSFSENKTLISTNENIADTKSEEITDATNGRFDKNNKIKTAPVKVVEKETIDVKEISIESKKEVNSNEIISSSTQEDKTPEKENLIQNPIKTDDVSAKANAEFIVYNNQVCLGEEVSFESQEDEQPVSYTWNFGDGTISHEKNPTHRYKDSHTYSVSLTLLNRQTGRETTTIQNDVVTIMPNPDAKFSFTETSLKHDDNKIQYPYTNFAVKKINKECSYEWIYGNGKTAISKNGKTIYTKTGNFTTTLIVRNNITGCSSTLKQKIFIKNGFDLFAPNAFSPNNNGGNETFIPKALLGWDAKFEMVIIDKSGKTIFKTTDKDEPWNGKMNNNGQTLSEGIYLWKVITYDAENNAHNHHGKVHLVK